jgi:hypothetical protein
MLKIFLVMSALVLGSAAFAAEDHTHTASVCSAKNAAVCAHLGLPKVLNSQGEVKFIAHVETPADAAVSNMKVDLWMDMGNGQGHNGPPVEIKDAGQNHFVVSKAYFVMVGDWLVRLDFDFEGVSHHIEIPVAITE